VKTPHRPLPRPTGALLERFWINVETGPCWRWLGPRNQSGYGTMNGYMAHRIAHEWFRGHIPDGYEVDHLCRVRHCVRPDHLEAVTPQENGRRAYLTTLHWRSRHVKKPEPECGCWGETEAVCAVPSHVRRPARRRARLDGLKTGDVVDYRWARRMRRGRCCPQCVKAVAEGRRTGCRWCGLILEDVGGYFLVLRSPSDLAWLRGTDIG
jgi:hypothetical protein